MADNIPEDYKLIPMSEITDEAREVAKAWYYGVSEIKDIREAHKLASDIMNYARRYHEQQIKNLKNGRKYTGRKQRPNA